MRFNKYIISFITICINLFFSCSENGVQPIPKEQWIVVTNLPYNPRFMFFDVCFIDSNKGWIVGGFDAYDGGAVLNTTDGGKHWSVQIDGSCWGLKSVYFIDNEYGWTAGGNGTILSTKNGGNNWNIKSIAQGIGFTEIFFLNRSFGWVVGSDESIYFTSDGGINWNQQRYGDQFGLQSVYFIDSLMGWAVGNFYGFSEKGIILRTVDGGITWLEQLTTPSEINTWTIKFFDTNNGWITCSKGIIYKTSDGGNNWNLINTETQNTIKSIEFINNSNGWAIGLLGTILYSTNGGDSWKLIDPLGDGWRSRVMQSITFADQNNGWIVGSDGFLVHYKRDN